MKFISGIIQNLDCCLDYQGLTYILGDPQLLNAILTLKNKGVRVRLLTDITEKVVPYLGQLMKGAEVFHLDGILGNFQIGDRIQYLYYIFGGNRDTPNSNPDRQLHTNIKSFVDTQLYFFDKLCDKAISAKEKISEIRRTPRTAVTEDIHDFGRAMELAKNLIQLAIYEILVIFPTYSSFLQAENDGLLATLSEAAARHYLSIKILIYVKDSSSVTNRIRSTIRKEHVPIEVQFVIRPIQHKILSLIIDQSVSLVIEVGSEEERESEEGVERLAIYSHDEIVVSSCLSIFETVWIQSEFDKQTKVMEAYSKMFKGLRVREESFRPDKFFEG
jgi:hypothetical protein